jgi:rsbT co-antagonist protein RsbR
MSDQIDDGAVAMAIHEIGINESAVERRKKIVGLDGADLSRIAALTEIVRPRIEQYTAAFFDYLTGQEEGRTLLSNRPLLERARRLKDAHLVALVSGNYGLRYAQERVELGLLYAKAGLDTRLFLGAFQHLLRNIGNSVMQAFERKPMEGFENFMSLNKVAFFDLGLIVDVLVYERERLIRQQAEAIRELSTPVLQIRDRLLLIPIIGVIDTHRARLITESLLNAIRRNRARVVVMDVTGVATIDSRVANHIMQTVAAARLMGAIVVVTGISSEVAQSLVALGIELSKLNTVGDLEGGLEEAERILGYRLLQGEGMAPLSLTTA